MVSLFKDRSPAVIIWLFVLGIVVHSYFFVTYVAIAPLQSNGLLSIALNNYVATLSPAFIIFIYQAVIFLQALRLNYLFTDHRMYSKVNYLLAMVYILLTGVFTEWSVLTPALIDNILVIWFFAKAIRLYNSPDPKSLLFNIGLLVGISTILYHPSALLLAVAYFALMSLRPFQIAEWLVLLMGFVCPYYFLLSYLYLTDGFATIIKYIPVFTFNIPTIYISPGFFVTVGVILVILIIGFIYWRIENRRLLIQTRKNWIVLLAMLLVLLAAPFINPKAGIESLILWIVPASPFLAKGFLGPKKNTLPALMFWALLALAVAKNWQIIK